MSSPALNAVKGADSTAHFDPLVQLEDVAVKTGEENETVVYKQRCRVYRFDFETSEWKERGTGDVKFLVHNETGAARVLMRQEKTLKLCMNHPVVAEVELKSNMGSDRAWTWAITDFADAETAEDGIVQTFAIKFKNSEIANAFKAKWEELGKASKKAADAAEAAAAAKSEEEPTAEQAAAAEAKAEENAEESTNKWDEIMSRKDFERFSNTDVLELWNKYDTDKSGAIDAAELHKVMLDLALAVVKQLKQSPVDDAGRAQIEKEIPFVTKQTLKKLDVNNDGKVSFSEFNKLDIIKSLRGD